MATLVDEQLKPLLERAVNTARAIQQLLSLRLGCVDGVPGAGVLGAAATAAAGRSAATQPCRRLPRSRSSRSTRCSAPCRRRSTPRTLVQLLLALLGSKPRDRFFQLNLPVVDDLLDPLHTLAAWSALDSAGVAAHVVASIDALSARVREAAALPLADLAVSLECRGAAVAARRR